MNNWYIEIHCRPYHMAVKEGCRVWCPWCHLRDRRLSRRSCSALWRKLCCKLEIKGEVRRFFLFVQSFYWPKTKTSFNRQFSPKRPKLVKNQAKGSEIHQIRTKWHPTYCGNPSILSSDLLWESTNSVLRATVGIHSSI